MNNIADQIPVWI